MSDPQTGPVVPEGKRTVQETREYDAKGNLIKTTTTIVVTSDDGDAKPWPGLYL